MPVLSFVRATRHSKCTEKESIWDSREESIGGRARKSKRKALGVHPDRKLNDIHRFYKYNTVLDSSERSFPDPETRAPFLYSLAVGGSTLHRIPRGTGHAERGWQKFVEYTRSLLDGARKFVEGNASIVSAKNRRICRYEDEDGSDVTSDDRILSWAWSDAASATKSYDRLG